MGYDLGLFEGNEDEIVDDLICPICKGKTHRGVKSNHTHRGVKNSILTCNLDKITLVHF